MEFYRKRLVEAIAQKNQWAAKYYKQQYVSALRITFGLGVGTDHWMTRAIAWER